MNNYDYLTVINFYFVLTFVISLSQFHFLIDLVTGACCQFAAVFIVFIDNFAV
jgi:hypothetical protein